MNPYKVIKSAWGLIVRLPSSFYQWLARLLIARDLESRGFKTSPTTIVHGSGKITSGGSSSVGSFTVIWCDNDPTGSLKDGRLVLGKNVYISDHCSIRASGCPIFIGDHTLIANGVTIVSANHGLKAGQPIASQAWESPGPEVRIGRDVWIGANSTVLPGATISDGAVIAAGAVVRGFIPPNEIWGGVPARKLGDRPA